MNNQNRTCFERFYDDYYYVGFSLESAYFAAHAAYGTLGGVGSERLGVPLLSKYLARLLLGHLKLHLPALIAQVSNLCRAAERGWHPPSTPPLTPLYPPL